jgi:hypothetical protein
MFPMLKGQHRVLEMVRVRRGDVDEIHSGIADEFFIRAVCCARRGDAVGGDEVLCLGFGAGGGDGRDRVGDVSGSAEGGVDEEIFDKF